MLVAARRNTLSAPHPHTELTPMTWQLLRRTVIFGTPIALGTLAAVHPMVPEDNVTVWNLIHTLQIPLASLLGIGVVFLLRGVRGGGHGRRGWQSSRGSRSLPHSTAWPDWRPVLWCSTPTPTRTPPDR
jgi:hypothetical protein